MTERDVILTIAERLKIKITYIKYFSGEIKQIYNQKDKSLVIDKYKDDIETIILEPNQYRWSEFNFNMSGDVVDWGNE